MTGRFLAEAIAYSRRGWSIIPTRGDKRPAVPRWKPYQSQRPDHKMLRTWFSGDGLGGLAVVLGDVSGGLVCRDFDVADSYKSWAADFPELAQTLPTVRTARGHHVYFRADVGKIIKLGDGELRGAGYCVLPPSRHPTGAVYRWVVLPPDGELPELDPFQNGLAGETERTEKTERTETQSNCSVLSVSSPAENPGLEEAISSTQPTAAGGRNRAVFGLARALKAIPSLADADPSQLRGIVKEWHRRALPVIGTKPFDDTWADFVYGWPQVKFPKGGVPMALILKRADAAALPAVAEAYDCPHTHRLIKLCRELQQAAGGGQFFLACRTAGELLDMDHQAAWRRLGMLVADGVLEVAKAGTKTKATRYRYVGGA